MLVYPTKWLDIESTTKVIAIFNNKAILKEAGILGGLTHLNIIKLFYFGFSKERKGFKFVME